MVIRVGMSALSKMEELGRGLRFDHDDWMDGEVAKIEDCNDGRLRDLDLSVGDWMDGEVAEIQDCNDGRLKSLNVDGEAIGEKLCVEGDLFTSTPSKSNVVQGGDLHCVPSRNLDLRKKGVCIYIWIWPPLKIFELLRKQMDMLCLRTTTFW